MHDELIALINSIAEQLHDKYRINCGGCCYLCYLVARELEKLGIRYKLVIEDHTLTPSFMKSNRLKVRKAIKNRVHFCEWFTITPSDHYTLEIDGVMVNHEKIFDSEAMSIGCIKSEDILWLYEAGNWNPHYNARKNNTIVENFVKRAFKRYGKRIEKAREEQENSEKGSICFGETGILSSVQNPDKSLFI